MTDVGLTIRVDAGLKSELDKVVRDEGQSVDTFVSQAIGDALEQRRTEAFFRRRGANGDIDAALAILRRAGGEPPREGDELPPEFGGLGDDHR